MRCAAQAKRQQYVGLRSARVHKEKLEVRYGYLRSQLEGIDRDFRELERIARQHVVPTQRARLSLSAILRSAAARPPGSPTSRQPGPPQTV